MGRTGCAGQDGLFGPFFPFRCNIHPIHTVYKSPIRNRIFEMQLYVILSCAVGITSLNSSFQVAARRAVQLELVC